MLQATRYNLRCKLRYISLCVVRYDINSVLIPQGYIAPRYIARFAYIANSEGIYIAVTLLFPVPAVGAELIVVYVNTLEHIVEPVVA